MFRHRFATLLLLLGAAAAQTGDGKGNQYKVSFNADASRVHVDANVWVEGNELALFGVDRTEQLKNGQAEFLENIVLSDSAGKPVALTDKGEGEYLVIGDRRLSLSYDVRLEHGKFTWPAGAEEVSYRTDEGVMATGNALFLVPGVKMDGPIDVSFAMPPGWTAQTPWRASGAANAFTVQSRRELVNNALYFGWRVTAWSTTPT
ncbi:MAG: hypothetical protein V4631_04130 [Pseudomonadota bacterium]